MSEYDSQVAVFQWAYLYEKQYPDLWLLNGSIMGAQIPPRILNKLKKAGMKKGKPDINLPVARGGYLGLWIELKRKGGPNPSQDQIGWLIRLAQAGHYTVCCKGSDAAISVLKAYISGEIIKPVKNDG
jgi:hypothetical protein